MCAQSIDTHCSRKWHILFFLAFLPCIVWGLGTWGSKTIYQLSFPYLLGYTYRIIYLLRALVFLSVLLGVYKRFLPNFYASHYELYVRYSVLSVLFILGGLCVRTKFWNYVLDGCFIAPLLEELISRFILYEARKQGKKTYSLVAIASSLSFGLMHFGYEPNALIWSVFFPKLWMHASFSLTLCCVFWWIPRLEVLMIVHAGSNLRYILSQVPMFWIQL